ncbi:Ubiquitin-like domain-containing protein [Caenorhabditis elegans]|uniref:Ubiquitin-like domain-containing protein n=1 Tax=Caenorhabditis elegans TaxID=6239 RepID=P91050_CAEEL|nr:Ubiquitin-like domain-containing protein [Caenorhabditis elegans]CCD64701.1 Ubiquitin-like domain-containing protein [Caenorhabditis elegans]|eukprot:NP_494548.1 Uncharacterized protein CELE_C16C8.11 [Caenorhabditis elegans]
MADSNDLMSEFQKLQQETSKIQSHLTKDFLSSSAKLSENRVLQATQELCGKLTEKQKVQDDTINLLLSALGQIQENQNKILNQFASMQSQLDIVKRRQDAYERDLIQQKPSVPEQKVGESSKKSPRSAESALKYVETCTKVVDLCIAVSMPGRLFSIGANKMESVEQLKMKIECQTGIPRTKFWLRLHGKPLYDDKKLADYKWDTSVELLVRAS